jgi:transcriptional regulator with XRE-family HTH domain
VPKIDTGFPALLRKYRELWKLSITDLSLVTGITRANIYLLESGKNVPRLDTVIYLANVLDINPLEIIKPLGRDVKLRMSVLLMDRKRQMDSLTKGE